MTQEKPYEYKELGATVNKIATQCGWDEHRTRFTYELYKELLGKRSSDWMADNTHTNSMGDPLLWLTDAAWHHITEKENAIWRANQKTNSPYMRHGFSFDDIEDDDDDEFI
jgi:hypothetical protein